jgi:23S rRNA pseudouridine1911/1915/1917 synthase
MKETPINIHANHVGQRLDKFLSSQYSQHSRSRWQQLIDQQFVLVNGQASKPSYVLALEDIVTLLPVPIVDVAMKPEAIPLEIVYEDADMLIVNKPQGMVVHPSIGHHSGTLVNALLHYSHDLSGLNGEKRPGIVHRLDKDTSGLMVVAKHDQAHRHLAAQLQTHTMARAYTALVRGVIKENKGKIIAPIGRDPDDRIAMDVVVDGKPSETRFEVVQRFTRHTLVHCHLATGRTHQIRVHMAFIQHPIESDPLYVPQKHPLHEAGQLLHAHQLTLVHPRTEKIVTFQAPLPAYFINIIERLSL